MIEKLISENTVALKELAHAINALQAAVLVQMHGVASSNQQAVPTVKAPVVEDKPKAKTLDYVTDIQPRAVGLVKNGKRPQALKILEHFGVKKFDHIAPEKFEECLTLITKAEAE